MSHPEAWYVVKQENGQCAVLPASETGSATAASEATAEQWGPYTSQEEAIARRVGLIRAGKCRPA